MFKARLSRGAPYFIPLSNMDARHSRVNWRRLFHRAYSHTPGKRKWNEEHPTPTGPFFDILIVITLIVAAIGAFLS